MYTHLQTQIYNSHSQELEEEEQQQKRREKAKKKKKSKQKKKAAKVTTKPTIQSGLHDPKYDAPDEQESHTSEEATRPDAAQSVEDSGTSEGGIHHPGQGTASREMSDIIFDVKNGIAG